MGRSCCLSFLSVQLRRGCLMWAAAGCLGVVRVGYNIGVMLAQATGGDKSEKARRVALVIQRQRELEEKLASLAKEKLTKDEEARRRKIAMIEKKRLDVEVGVVAVVVGSVAPGCRQCRRELSVLKLRVVVNQRLCPVAVPICCGVDDLCNGAADEACSRGLRPKHVDRTVERTSINCRTRRL